MQTVILLVLSVVGLYVLQKYIEFRQTVNSIQNFPGFRVLFGVGNQLLRHRIPLISFGNFATWKYKHKDFADAGMDIFSTVSVWPHVVTYFVADAPALKEITASRARFPKPLWQYKVLSFYGSNIVITEGDEWKRHRKITAPAFSERNNRLVWDESIRIVQDLCGTVWGTKEDITIDNIVNLTVPIALFVIGVAGFGRRISWSEDIVVPAGHAMTFKDALHTVSTDLFLKIVVPDFVLKLDLTTRLKTFRVAYDELERYMVEMIRARKTSEKEEERYDLFSSLLDANEDELDGQTKLSDSETIGNIFIFLIAGHETTAHTLAYAFIMLALYQDEQEILYQHIKSVLPDGRIPTYEEMGLLTQSMAVFHETLRMFPPVCSIPKHCVEDTTLLTRNAAGEAVLVPIPKGTNIVIHTPGLHYNPRYWPDPHTFKPARFLSDWPRDAFMPFSGGARSCLGRRFSETEGVAILTYLVSRYRIEVKEEPQFASETFEQRKDRLLESRSAITLYPVKAGLVFKRR
ncbi:hypothetical protein SCP_0311320 [Sparassis crispa]|uniref:Cytochrome P450 n=1 Tax=Sparassis crispa TaxID=139825 RepID=A0A401GH24_9APHY|nr:hypothetical protein SCP_0311320 [Sparassis crispa]GBE81403.1 hypothetical protein SCP_0311320 [Sparassis crispa]